MKIGKQLGDLSETTLRFYRQIGVEEVGLPGRYSEEQRGSRPHVPPAQLKPAALQPEPVAVAEITRRRERTAQGQLNATTLGLPVGGAIVLGRPERDAEIPPHRAPAAPAR